MFGFSILLVFLVLLASYGIYALSNQILRRISLFGRERNVKISFAITICMLIVLALCAAGGITALRSESYMLGSAQVGISVAEQDAQTYLEAYTKGYTDAVDGYLGELFSTASITSIDTVKPAADEDDALPERTTPILSDPEFEEEDPAPTEEGEETEESVSEKESTQPIGVIVYYTRSGSVLHRDANCPYLKNAKEVLHADLADAPSRRFCSHCG